ncbi:MAG: carboxypeptidase regulatory-like domain-containing protein [Candidatus Cloacimonadaceae bacterium]
MYKKLIFIVLALSLCLALLAQTQVVIGTGTTTNTDTGAPAPYGTWYKAFRQQYLVLASELNNAGGNAGNIYSIAFQVSALNNTTPMNNYRIRLKTTNQTSLSSTFETGTYTQVFQAGSFIPVVGWNTHTFSAPFHWNGTSNLLVDIMTDLCVGSYARNPSVYYSSTTFNSSLRYQSDSTSGTNATSGTAARNRSNMRFTMALPNVQDLAALSLEGNITPSVGANANYVLRVKNLSPNSVSNYSLKLMASPNQELASLPGSALASMEERNFSFSWIPTATGSMLLFGRVIFAADENLANNDSPSLDITVLAEGTQHITIGTGTTTSSFPFYTLYEDARTQMLFTTDELAAHGMFPGMEISSIAFDVQSANAIAVNNFLVRLKHTNATTLSGFDTDANSFQSCHTSSAPLSGTGWNTFQFSEPFLYTGGGNLLVDVSFDNSSWSGNSSVYATSAPGKTWAHNADSNNGANLTGGSAQTNRPNLRFAVSGSTTGAPEFYITPSSHSFGDVNIGGSSSQNFNIMNIGGDGLGIQSITISGSSAFRLSDLPQLPVSLNSFAALSFNVIYTPLLLGTDSALITITDDQGERRTHSIQLTGNGINDITIGDGNQTGRIPMDFYYKSSLYETIFTANELNNFIGMITGIKFYNQFSSNLMAKPVKIWLGRTTQNDLSSGWIPASEMTLVYNGVADFPSGSNTINITFPEPFLFLEGGNLVMMVQRPLDGSYFSSSDLFLTSSDASNRARNMMSDTTDYDPYSPSGGSATGVYPKTTFVVIPGGVGHITGVVKNAEGLPLSGVAVHLNHNTNPQMTAADGSFAFMNLLPNEYHLSFHKHGYFDWEQVLQLQEDDELSLEITLQSLPQVMVSGMIIASDTLAPIAGVNISLQGYEDYHVQSAADGRFVFPQVFAQHSYQYKFSHPGYSNITGILELQDQNYSFGSLQMDELAFAPYNLQAAISADPRGVALSWHTPNPNAIGIQESFENAQFPPANWSRIITNSGGILSNGAYPHWERVGEISSGSTLVSPSDDSFQAGLWWDYNYQNEWLITEDFTCPSDAILSFDTRVYYGSENGDSYMLKLSTDAGQNWITLWNAATLPTGWNDYQTPISLDISEYSGRYIRIAFHALAGSEDDGLWYDWFIDNFQVLSSFARSPRSLEAYDVFRFTAANLHNPAAWQQINSEPIAANSYLDAEWENLPQGDYYWAVKARYTNSVSSSAAISNPLSKSGGIPAAPQNLRLEIFGEDLLISWDEVTTDTTGSPLVVAGYEIYVLTTPDETPDIGNLVDITTETSFYFPEVTPYIDRLFFVVKARGTE